MPLDMACLMVFVRSNTASQGCMCLQLIGVQAIEDSWVKAVIEPKIDCAKILSQKCLVKLFLLVLGKLDRLKRAPFR